MLSARAEAAAPEEARGLLEELARRTWGWNACPGGVDPDFWVHRWVTFNRLLDINTPEAHLAAAMMLVPEGMHVTLDTGLPAAATIAGTDDDWEYAATPALALIAAIARSLGK